jgi:hypothetical protein
LESYEQRDSILEFVEKEQNGPWFNDANEVMMKERVDPRFIKALVVPTQRKKEDLAAYLHKRGLAVRDDWIRVGRYVTEELIT